MDCAVWTGPCTLGRVIRRAVTLTILPTLALAMLLRDPAPVASAAPSHASLVKAYCKAKKDKDRAKAWAAIEAAAPLTAKEVPALQELAVERVQKRGRKIDKGGGEWFDKKKDGWKGRYMTSGKGKKGLVLALHGGGAGSGDCGQARSSFSGGISSLKMRGLYPEVLQKTEYGWTDPVDTEKWVLELLRAARRASDVDPDRVYVTGHSMGGFGTWTYGAVHADLFAAGTAFAGAPTVFWLPGKKDKEADGVLEGYLPNLYNLPLFVYQSLDDPNVPAAANVFACAQLAKLHAEDSAGWEFVYEEVDGRGHAFPEKGAGPGLEWMADHVRNPRPKKIRWEPVRDWKTTFYWLRWESPWLRSNVVAELDPERNAIDISIVNPRSRDPARTAAERRGWLESLSVQLDDHMLDLSKDILVTLEGKEQTRRRAVRRLATLVRNAEEREDPRYAFPVELRVGLAAATTGEAE